MSSELTTLKSRADFLRVAGLGVRSARPSLVVQAAPQADGRPGGGGIRVGFTASRKVGNAVVRNRAKRRMRAVAARIIPSEGIPGTDYVLIARASTANRAYSELVADLEANLRRIRRSGTRMPAVLTSKT